MAWRIAYTTSVHLLPAHKNPVPIFPAHQEGQRVTTEYPAHQFPDAGKGGTGRGESLVNCHGTCGGSKSLAGRDKEWVYHEECKGEGKS